MKKLLGILVLGLLWCNFSVAGEMNVFKKKIKLPEDIAQGYKKNKNFPAKSTFIHAPDSTIILV